MKNILKITLLSAIVAFFVGCETGELELLVSPNDVTIDNADPNFVLNDIQLTFNGIVSGYSAPSRAITRQVNQFDTYNNAVSETTLQGEWAQSYQMFANIDLLGGINETQAETGGVPYHLGVAQIIEAYAYMLLVDYVGNVPFTEANLPSEFPNPMVDSGAEVYAAQLALLDEAIANLNLGDAQNSPTPEDLYHGDFDASNWIALANTLKIRANLNTGNAAGITAALSGNIIDTNEEDFQFLYGTVANSPESRHPFFTGNYLAAGAGQYMSNNFLDLLNAGFEDETGAPFEETDGPQDPRLRYYMYRQSNSAPSGSDLPCAGNPRYDYCYVGNLYWGRDHADDEGIPNDAFKRTAYGIYPGGGAFDDDSFQQTPSTDNLGGEGIQPIYLASFTHFALAEAALTLGTPGNPGDLMELGIRRSMNKVRDFAGSLDNGPFEMTDADINAYVARVRAEFNSASAADKIDIVAREFYLAAWGNGTEPYNLYRRTGAPDLQSPVIAAGPFPRAFRYPDTEIDGNPNIQQQPATTRVFWDNNPDNLD
ncbi:MAG TPA: SusD/RagB family nutrient-binding outer membrane lipoprotein [Flavobacteriaceae bacterium]|jgi:hypothetical protein|nr:SusD/RagB family nutrient-binding outer membrane lipoprotein [Flavobacteriaceae bacterium]HBR54931.1 SusD/RagB family nutrient-binding outer membrane lipoprotein [Flavobacteriaceae bacterium]HIB49588.1 SusD/RagB family nutrient-binding outer membrane lipoprotein [Flavobacteriaceae bacterium]HIN98150.1 SusD/RagB family nutrient-binding outer membrane lipoprotein [Flavobacteriaceae bacterium]|tara:strand:- start:73 stop:1692 length:1620 start_codon:yes stop_codon:yes gene_type:complete